MVWRFHYCRDAKKDSKQAALTAEEKSQQGIESTKKAIDRFVDGASDDVKHAADGVS